MRKIGFDIDDVLAMFMQGLLRYVADPLGREYQVEDMRYKIHYGEIWGVELTEAVDLVGRFYESDQFAMIEPYPEATQLLVQLHERGDQIFFITSRPQSLAKETKRWLDRWFPTILKPERLFLTSHFYGGKKGKGEVAKSLGLDIFVEDDLKHVSDCVDHGVRVLLFDQPWNRGYVPVPELCARVENYNQLASQLRQ